MPRYIDADKLIAHLKDEIEGCKPPFGGRTNGKSIAYGTILGLKSAISFAETLSTADVVPKSEYDRLEKLFNDMTQEAKGYLNRLYGIRAEVVREILADIESVMSNRFSNIMLGEDIRLRITELKKKYQEGEPNVSK